MNNAQENKTEPKTYWQQVRADVADSESPRRVIAMCIPVVLLLLLILGVIIGAAISTWS